MRARIYQPTKSAMTSGMAGTRDWILDYTPEKPRQIDPLMGWTSSAETQPQVRLRFDSKEAALAYAEEHGIDAVVLRPRNRRANVRPRGYGENFASNRRASWTH